MRHRFVLALLLLGGCPAGSRPTQSSASLDELRREYLERKHAMLATPHEDSDMLGLRRVWISRFVKLSEDTAEAGDASRARALAVQEMVNLAHAHSDEAPAALATSMDLARRALQVTPDRGGFSEIASILFGEDITPEHRTELVTALTRFAERASGAARRAALVVLGEEQRAQCYEAGDAALRLSRSAGAARCFRAVVAEFAGSPEAETAARALAELTVVPIGARCPPIAGRDADGAAVRVSASERVLWIVFWGHWCGACAESVDSLRQRHDELVRSGVTVVGVNSDPVRSVASARVAPSVPWADIADGSTSGAMATLWNVRAWPTHVLVGKDGTIRYRGALDDALWAQLDRLRSE